MSLREIQVRVADWIRAPEGVAKALADDANPERARQLLTATIRSDETLGARDRLEIYANAYFYRILGALTVDYAVLERLLGQALFHDMVTSYLLVEPSRHPSLRYAGTRLPDFLAAHPAAQGIRERAPWAGDLAAFEWSRVDVFDAPDAKLLTRDRLASRAPESFGALELVTHAAVEIRRFEYPVDRLFDATHETVESLTKVTPNPTRLLIWRQMESVRHRALDSVEADALARVASGIEFEALCEWTATRIDEAEAPARVAGWLESWLAEGLLWDRGKEA
jgi:hypothetical protein